MCVWRVCESWLLKSTGSHPSLIHRSMSLWGFLMCNPMHNRCVAVRTLFFASRLQQIFHTKTRRVRDALALLRKSTLTERQDAPRKESGVYVLRSLEEKTIACYTFGE